LHLLKPRTAWATAIHLRDELSLPLDGEPDFVLRTRKFFRNPRQPHTIADPFLFEDQGRTYVLFETQVGDDFGRIEAAEVTSAGPKHLGVILSEPFHLSYPSVFRIKDQIYLMPECAGSGEMRLYRFEQFPRNPIFVRSLKSGKFADPSPIVVDGTLFIFATTADGLQLFHTDDPIRGSLELHPASPLTKDPAFSRCGGTPFRLGHVLLRPAQNCADQYGSNLNLMRIEELTRDRYRESIFQQDIFECEHDWNAEGGHHLSVAKFEGRYAVAVDGQARDHDVNRIVSRLWMIASGKRRR